MTPPAAPRRRFTRLRRGRRGPAGEELYRERRYHGARFYTSRQEHENLTVVVKRFPGPARPGARTFVLVHGIGVSSRYFQPLAARLAQSDRVFLVDLPGYGAAPDPKRDVTLADHAAVLAGFLRQSRIERPVLVGHSMGTQVVSVLAQRHPDVTDSVVMLAPTMQPAARTRWRAIGALLRDGLREPPLVTGIAITDYLWRCGLPYLWRQLPHLLGDRLEDRVPQHAARTLVITGDRDPVVPPAWAASLAAAHPHAEFHEVRGPHVIMHTDPVTIAGHITAFLDAADARDAEVRS